jgi:hypothetical protein
MARLLMTYSDINGKFMSVSNERDHLIKGKIFKRRGWHDDISFTYYVPEEGYPYFAYCDSEGTLKPKTGQGKTNGHEFSTVGSNVLINSDIIEIGEVKMATTEFLSVGGGKVTIDACDEVEITPVKSDLDKKPKWVGKFYNIHGEHIKTVNYKKRKDAIKELKLTPTRTLVLYKAEKVLTIDMPVKEEEV